jgi:hypothetical protein
MAKRKAAKKTSAKRSSARKGAAKRTTARKGAAKRSSTRKGTAKRTSARKASTGRSSARKGAAKGGARKTAARRAAPARERTAKTGARSQGSARQPSRIASAATAVRGAVAGAVTAVTDKLPWGSSGKPDGLALLEQDHRRFEQLLKQGEETTEKARDKRRELLDTITREMNLHELMEENVLYPALKEHPEAREIVLEGYQEHHVADKIVEELHQVATDDERWGAKFKVLKENIEHHIQEEEGAMFRTARGIFSQEQLQELGDKMRAVRNQAR